MLRPVLRHFPLLPAALLAGCASPVEIAVEQSEEVPTVFTVTWSTELEAVDQAWVEYGPDGEYGPTFAASVVEGQPEPTVVVGMKPETTYHLRGVVSSGGRERVSGALEVTTGAVPTSLPTFTVEQGDPGDSWSGFLVTSVLMDPPAAIILDESGEIVWWSVYEDYDLMGRVRLAPDRASVLFADVNLRVSGINEINRVALDGTWLERYDTPDLHHDFTVHEDGTLAWLAYDPRVLRGGETIAGDSIRVLEPDGTEQRLYTAWDDFEYDPEVLNGPDLIWPHANALDHLPEERAYLVSFMLYDAIAKIDATQGEMQWLMGGEFSDFTLPDGSTDLFGFQHQMQRLDDSLLVFVNGEQPGGESRAVEYTVDAESGTVEEAWSYWPDPPMESMVLGDVHRFSSGNTLVTFGYSGQIHEVTPEGEVVWKLTADMGDVLGYTTWYASLEPPDP